jgi:hypothetical protein
MTEWRNRSLERKDRFRDWGWFHKSVVFVFAGLALSAVFRLIVTYDAGQFLVKEERIIPRSAEAIWPWIVDSENRVRWQVHLTEIDCVKGGPNETGITCQTGTPDVIGSARLLTYIYDGETSYPRETTTDASTAEYFKTYQASDLEERSLEISLEPLGSCETKVTVSEIIYYRNFATRYWSFYTKKDDQERIDSSISSLEDWVMKKTEECS